MGIGFWINRFCFGFQQSKALIPQTSGFRSSVVPDEKSAIIYIIAPLCVMCLVFSKYFQDFSFIYGSHQFNYDVPICDFICIFPALNSL